MFRQEYPNPQFEREKWQNLNGEWDFYIDYSVSGKDRKLFENDGFEGKITVPFAPESVLSGVGNKDFMPSLWYLKKVMLKNPYKNGRTRLHFGAADYHTELYINKKFVGRHDGGYSSFSFDITDFISDGENIITVNVIDDLRSGHQPAGKQCKEFYSSGCNYTRTTGIWQTVWVEYLPQSYIVNFKIYPDILNKKVDLQLNLQGCGELSAQAYFEGRECGSVAVISHGGTLNLSIPLCELHLWDLGQGNLYDLHLKFNDDEVKSYFGMRSIAMQDGKFMLNGRSVFQRLVLDQGFYPDGIYTAKDEQELKRDIELSMACGFNGARLHEKVFEPRFLYHCDKMGYMVWGEHANWGLDISDPASLSVFLKEWMEVVERDFNHPSIVGWCPFNETWDYDGRRQCDDTLRTVYRYTKIADPTRPCIDTSGWFHVETDIFDIHDYNQNAEQFSRNIETILSEGGTDFWIYKRQQYHNEPFFVSEYGGIQWDSANVGGWGYGSAPKTEEEFLERYQALTESLLFNPKVFGFCYTQLYDVEQEVNGLYTYSRVAKFDVERIKKINTQKAAIE